MSDYFTDNDPTHGYEQIDKPTRVMTEAQRILALAIEGVRIAQLEFSQAEDAYISCRINKDELEKARLKLVYNQNAERDARINRLKETTHGQ